MTSEMTQETETMVSERGRTLRRGVRTITVTYKGQSKSVEQPGFYPDDLDDIDDAVLVGADLEPADAALRSLKEQADRIPTPETIRRIRRKLKLNQRNAGTLLGGGASAFDKYERQGIEPSQALVNLLYLLDRHPELLDELRGRAGTEAEAREVRTYERISSHG